MKHYLPKDKFLVKVSQLLKLNHINNDKVKITSWDPIRPGEVTSICYSLVKYHEFEYYELCDRGKLYITPKIFSDRYSSLPDNLYEYILSSKFNSENLLYDFPYRNNSSPAFVGNDQKINILEEFEESVAQLRELVNRITSFSKLDENEILSYINYSENKAYINGYVQLCSTDPLYNFELDKKWNSEKERNEDIVYNHWLFTPSTITTFGSWYDYAKWEIYNKFLSGGQISICRNCGRIINLEERHHRDRVFCLETENKDCYRQRERNKKARYRFRLKSSK